MSIGPPMDKGPMEPLPKSLNHDGWECDSPLDLLNLPRAFAATRWRATFHESERRHLPHPAPFATHSQDVAGCALSAPSSTLDAATTVLPICVPEHSDYGHKESICVA